jgi:hypothetical protein
MRKGNDNMEKTEFSNSLMIVVNGVIPDKQKEAEEELKDFFGPLAVNLETFIEVVVTDKFSETVEKIQSERRGVKIPYNAKRSHVVALGKVIPYKREDKLAFAVVFDISLFGKWERERALCRTLTYCHERVHIGDEKILCDDIGIAAFFSEPKTVESVFFCLAHDIWMEYNAERYCVETCVKVAKEVHANAIVEFKSHKNYAKSYISSIESLPEFLHQNIPEFMNGKMTIDELWSKIYPRVRETLILAAFTTAHSHALGKIDDELLIVQGNVNYSFFFDTWKSIEKDLWAIYGTAKKYDKEILTRIANKLNMFYEKCGTTLNNTKNGIYIGVKPVDF